MSNDTELIAKLGGVTKVAAICRVTPSAVSQWQNDGIPDARRQLLELMFPEVFAEAKAA